MLIAPAAVRRTLVKTSSRVADENTASASAAADADGRNARSQSRWKYSVSFLCEILLAPLSMLSCLSSHTYMSGADGVWVTAEVPQTAEVSHLMVRDSLRYAILM